MQRYKHHRALALFTNSCVAAIFLCFFTVSAQAQTDSAAQRTRIAIFSPLYLDSAFDASGNFKHGKNFPKIFNAGLEFYQGIQLAIDSLEKENIPLDIHIYDTRSSKKLESILQEEEIKDMDLLMGYVNVNEASLLGRAAANLEIPFVNVNLPNDAGIKSNPNYVILNPTLATHIGGIYKFLQKNFALSSIIYFRKKGSGDDMLKKFFADAEKSTSSVPLKIRYVTLEDTITTDQLARFLDSTKQSICIAGSLDVNFGLTLARQLATLSRSYKSVVVGMPTWDETDFNKAAYRGIEIVYSSPTFVNNENKLVQLLQNHYKTKYFSRTDEMVYRGFEVLYHLTKILQNPGNTPLGTQLATKKTTLFGELDIQPVVNRQTGEPDYYENKKLYFIRIVDGVVKGVY
jgi:hypothetical protein